MGKKSARSRLKVSVKCGVARNLWLRNYVVGVRVENFSWQVNIVAATLVCLTGIRQTYSISRRLLFNIYQCAPCGDSVPVYCLTTA